MNIYLEKIALSRLVKEMAKGNISKPVSDLAKSGFIRSSRTYEKGMIEGNKNLAEKHNVGFQKTVPGTVNDNIATKGGGYAMIPTPSVDKNIVLIGSLRDKSNKLINQGAIRHEIFEAREMNRLKGTSVPHVQAIPSLPKEVLEPALKNMNPGYREAFMKRAPREDLPRTEAGTSHLSQRVLMSESNMVRANPYLNHISKLRSLSGETDKLRNITGKEYGRDKMVSSDFKKGR